MEREIQKLSLLREKIRFMRSSKEKALLIKDYYNIVAFLLNAGYINDIDIFNFDDDEEEIYERLYDREMDKIIKNLTSNPTKLREIFQTLIDYYHKYSFSVKKSFTRVSIDPTKMNGVLSSFFWNINDDVLMLFRKMTSEKRFVQNGACRVEGVAINTMNTDFAYAVISNPKDDLEYYLSIAHEMGHIYTMYLQRLNPNFVNVEITSEVVSLLFEKLFLHFLEINDFMYFEYLKSQELHHSFMLNYLSISKIIMNLHANNLVKGYDKDLLTIFPKVDEKELLSIFNKDCGLDYQSLQKFDYGVITYPIGEIISNHFFFSIIDDHDKGMNELKKFIMSCQRMSLNELISLFMNDLTDSFEYIDLFMKKYKSLEKKLTY